jgi:hypothetical protein
MRIIFQRLRVDEAAKHHGLPPAVINTHLDKEAAALIGTVVEVDAAFIVPALARYVPS